MNEGFEHMTVVVTDLDEVRQFFGLLGFVERVAVVVSGEQMAQDMGIADWEAEHVTLELRGRRARRSSCCTSIARRSPSMPARARCSGRASTTCASG